MQNLKIALAQADLAWEDKKANLSKFETMLSGLEGRADLFMLPEMFSTGFTMNAKPLAETMDGETVAWVVNMAAKMNAVITGSLIIKEKGKYFNRLLWAEPDGRLSIYDKRHLFSMADEEKTYAAGSHKLIVELKGWKICPLVCYDLRFPVWLRNKEKYDLLLFVASWPDRRIQHWLKLLSARAIENQCFVAGVNRIGADGNEFTYPGKSIVVTPMGDTIADLEARETVEIVNLDHEEIIRVRRYMPFLKDMDKFSIV